MKVAGALTLVVGGLLLVFLTLWPAEISVLGTSASCGLPVVNAFTAPPDGDDLVSAAQRECHSRSGQRLLLAAVLFAVAGPAGGIMLGAGTTHTQPYWDGYQWRNR